MDVPQLLTHGTYTALVPTGWNRGGEELKPGSAHGLVGHYWKELVVKVDFGVMTEVSRVVNHFGEAVEVSVAATPAAAAAEDWLPAASLPSGESALRLVAQLLRLRWRETSRALNGGGQRLEFWGRESPNAAMAFEPAFLAGDLADTAPRETPAAEPSAASNAAASADISDGAQLLTHGTYTALVQTGWNRGGEELKPGSAHGLVGHFWGQLVVQVDFGVMTEVSRVVNHFGEPVEISVAAQGNGAEEDWAPAATLPKGGSPVRLTAQRLLLRWQATSQALNEGGRRLEFWGRQSPDAVAAFETAFLAGEPQKIVPFEDVPVSQRSCFTYVHVGEGTLISPTKSWYRTMQFRGLGTTEDQVRQVLERMCSSNQACMGYHIQTNRREGRYLEGAVLLDATRKFPPELPLELEAVRQRNPEAGISWLGFGDSTETARPDRERASVAVGMGWNSWQAYLRENPFRVLTVMLGNSAQGRLLLNFRAMSGDVVATVDVPASPPPLVASLAAQVASQLQELRPVLRFVTESGEHLTDSHFSPTLRL